MDLLPEEFVIGGLWESAPVLGRRTSSGRIVEDGVYLTGDGTAFASISQGVMDRADGSRRRRWHISLRLPGPLGCGARGLERRIQERLEGGESVPAWVRELPAAEASKRLAIFDALAASRGWPTGQGAPVYGWGWCPTRRVWVLSGLERRAAYLPERLSLPCGRVPELGITDPMEALEAAYRATR